MARKWVCNLVKCQGKQAFEFHVNGDRIVTVSSIVRSIMPDYTNFINFSEICFDLINL